MFRKVMASLAAAVCLSVLVPAPAAQAAACRVALTRPSPATIAVGASAVNVPVQFSVGGCGTLTRWGAALLPGTADLSVNYPLIAYDTNPVWVVAPAALVKFHLKAGRRYRVEFAAFTASGKVVDRIVAQTVLLRKQPKIDLTGSIDSVGTVTLSGAAAKPRWSASKWAAFSKRPLTVEFRPYAAAKWVKVRTLTTSTSGKVTLTRRGGAGQYRLRFSATHTYAAATSPVVTLSTTVTAAG